MCMLPSATIVMKSFEKYRAFFLALCSSGSAFGNLILPPLLTYMISEYSWRGTFLLLSALALQCLPSSLLFLPLIERADVNIYVLPSDEGSTLKPKSTVAGNYFMLSGRISRNIGENIFRSYTGSTSKNTYFHVLVAYVNCTCLTTRWKYDVIYLTFLALDVIL